MNPTNPPFPHLDLATFQTLTATASQETGSTYLKGESLLMSEFGHASAMAFQANQGRTDLLNLYLLLTGVIVTGMGVSVSAAFAANVIGPLLAVIVGLVLAFALSFGFFARLINLTEKYHDALITMDIIKEFYIQQLREQMPQLGSLIRWRLDTLPVMGKRSSGTTFFTGSIIALMGSFSLGAATELLFYYTHGFDGLLQVHLSLGPVVIRGFVVDVPVFVAALLVFVVYYVRARQRDRTRAHVRNLATQLGFPAPLVK
ncbi:MAG: hypothetical protein IVW57_01330 [Ktedonobacterales bacterium]|nr:hypothetical protein [Ktedonobacterales bacterium]